MTNPEPAARGDAPVIGLDPRYFTDPALFERALERLFYRSWLLAGHASQLARPGDYLTLAIYDQDIVVLRNRDGRLKAFYNVCQHRGHRLLDGEGNRKLLVCPYHAWSYDLDGRFRQAPNSRNVPGFDGSAICLTEVRVEDFLGFVFVNLDPDCASMDATFPGIRAEMLALCPDVEQRRHAYQHQADEGCNWFVAVENYNECYHCNIRHPAFAKGVIDPATYSIAPYGELQVLHHTSSPPRDDTAWYDISGADYGSFFLWPASAIQFYPGGVVNSYTWRPLAVDDVRVIRGFYSVHGDIDATLQTVIDNDRATTFQEDLDIVREVQRGLRSRGYRPGPLIIDPAGGISNELPIHRLHQWLRAAID